MDHWNTFWGLFALIMGFGLPTVILMALAVFIRAMASDIGNE